MCKDSIYGTQGNDAEGHMEGQTTGVMTAQQTQKEI